MKDIAVQRPILKLHNSFLCSTVNLATDHVKDQVHLCIHNPHRKHILWAQVEGAEYLQQNVRRPHSGRTEKSSQIRPLRLNLQTTRKYWKQVDTPKRAAGMFSSEEDVLTLPEKSTRSPLQCLIIACLSVNDVILKTYLNEQPSPMNMIKWLNYHVMSDEVCLKKWK